MQSIRVQTLPLRVSPILLPHIFVQLLCKSLSEPIRQSLNHDNREIVVIGLVLLAQLIDTKPGAYRKHPDPIIYSRCFRGDEIGNAPVGIGSVGIFFRLLSQAVEFGLNLGAGFIFIDFNVVTDRVGGEDGKHTARLEALVLDDSLQLCLRIVKQPLSLLPDRGIVKDLGVAPVGVLASQLPHLKERLPVNVGHKVLQGHIIQHNHTGGFGLRGGRLGEIDYGGKLARFLDREIHAILERVVVVLSQFLILLRNILHKIIPGPFIQQTAHNHHALARIKNMDRGLGVAGGDFHGRMHLAGGCSTNQKREFQVQAFHFLGNVNHLVKRGGDEA
eukprot:comp23382_c1_seq1/m.38704 comp23382_c1_seq1/g.38704  ORF comp23382_c1_seq1/g.38704 comp23382_c1_seq1/m.38704 type:complete len:332 (+) comp23382_c1_seq1:1140-2135(+)